MASLKKASRIQFVFHENTTISLRGAPQLPPSVRNLRPDLWFVNPANGVLNIVEVTVPYGQMDDRTDCDPQSTLKLRMEEKLQKYLPLVKAVEDAINIKVNLYVIVVSSLGAVPSSTLVSLRKLLFNNKRLAEATARKISLAAIRGSALIYWNIRMNAGEIDANGSANLGDNEVNSSDDQVIDPDDTLFTDSQFATDQTNHDVVGDVSPLGEGLIHFSTSASEYDGLNDM